MDSINIVIMAPDNLIHPGVLCFRDNCDLNEGAQEQGFENPRSLAMVGDSSAATDVRYMILNTAA